MAEPGSVKSGDKIRVVSFDSSTGVGENNIGQVYEVEEIDLANPWPVIVSDPETGAQFGFGYDEVEVI